MSISTSSDATSSRRSLSANGTMRATTRFWSRRPSRPRSPVCATSKSRSGRKSRLLTSTISRCTRSPPRLDAGPRRSGRGLSDQRADRQVAEPGQPTQRQAVRLARARQLLRVRDDQLLGRRRRDREDARGELVARLGLQQRRILPPVQEVLVGDARRLLLDDLALLPPVAHAHREAADGRARRQRDAEAPLARAVLRVAEDEVQLGERQRIVDHRLRRQGHQLQARAVGAGQAQRRRRLGREDVVRRACRVWARAPAPGSAREAR